MTNPEASTQPAPSPEAPADAETRQQLVAELDALIGRMGALWPDYEPPPFSPRRFVALLKERLRDLPLDAQLPLLGQVRGLLEQDLLDVEVWKGLWYMLNYTVQYNVNVVKRRFSGEYETDAWGLDWEFLDVMRPFLNFLYQVYWRVQTFGLERIPVEGRALLVANRSGPLPWDSLMLTMAVTSDHPAQRLVRVLQAEGLATVPFLSSWSTRLGQIPAAEDNGLRLLEQDELVAVFPEGNEAASKSFRDRYRLARFGQGEFVQMALRSGAPLIPVAVVGAEETYVTLGRSPTAARLTGLPYVPITAGFPWLGLLGLVPLPSKWYFGFGEPILTADYGPEAADNLVLVSQISDRVRHTVQEMIDGRLVQRRSVFFG
jgi:1-acyl-sn-glycerol-3-phosphate acyltransferase